jgi:hypothetical protein
MTGFRFARFLATSLDQSLFGREPPIRTGRLRRRQQRACAASGGLRTGVIIVITDVADLVDGCRRRSMVAQVQAVDRVTKLE